ncbi:MAG: hypothetical protein WD059_00550 [Balneolaceae bacterium]
MKKARFYSRALKMEFKGTDKISDIYPIKGTGFSIPEWELCINPFYQISTAVRN